MKGEGTRKEEITRVLLGESGGEEVPQSHSGRIPMICDIQRVTSRLAEVRYVFISPWGLASEWMDFKTNVEEEGREISRRSGWWTHIHKEGLE